MQPLTAAAYHDITTPADPRIAPDGSRVAFLRRHPDGDEEYASTT